jgi:hypothetical protein
MCYLGRGYECAISFQMKSVGILQGRSRLKVDLLSRKKNRRWRWRRARLVSCGGPIRTGGGYESLRLFFWDIVCSCSWASCLNSITLDLIGQVSSLVTRATRVNQAKCVLANRETNSSPGAGC